MSIRWGLAADVTLHRHGDEPDNVVSTELGDGEVAVATSAGAIYGTPKELAELGARMFAEFGGNSPRFVLMIGNPVAGLKFHGPTDGQSAGFEDLVAGATGSDWWIEPMTPVQGEPTVMVGGEVHDRYVTIYGFTSAGMAEALRLSCGMRHGDFGRWKGNVDVTIDRDPWIDKAIDFARINGLAYDVTMSQRFEGRS